MGSTERLKKRFGLSAEDVDDTFAFSDDEEADDALPMSTINSGEEVARLPDGSLDDLPELDPASDMAALGSGESLLSKYGEPRSSAVVEELIPRGGGGLVWHCSVVTPEWTGGPKEVTADGQIKPRRPTMPILAANFFSSLVCTPDGRYVFDGVLNGWPGVCTLELVSITIKTKSKIRRSRIKRIWDVERTPGVKPAYPTVSKSVRVTLRAAPWTAVGWAPGVPGYVWWFFAQRVAPSLAYGTDILASVRQAAVAAAEAEPKAKAVHIFAHRYALKVESNKDRVNDFTHDHT